MCDIINELSNQKIRKLIREVVVCTPIQGNMPQIGYILSQEWIIIKYRKQ